VNSIGERGICHQLRHETFAVACWRTLWGSAAVAPVSLCAPYYDSQRSYLQIRLRRIKRSRARESCGVTLARSIVFFAWFIAHTARCNCKRRPGEQPSIIYFFSLFWARFFPAAGTQRSFPEPQCSTGWSLGLPLKPIDEQRERSCTPGRRLNYSNAPPSLHKKGSSLWQIADYFIFSLTRRYPEVSRQWVAA
jgi:hypothetical protein